MPQFSAMFQSFTLSIFPVRTGSMISEVVYRIIIVIVFHERSECSVIVKNIENGPNAPNAPTALLSIVRRR